VRNSAHLLASSAAAASIAAAIILQRKEESESTSNRDLVEKSSSGRNGGLLGFRNVDAFRQRNNNTVCSCESLPTCRSHQTISLLDKTSSKVSLESRYKIDWDNPLGEGGFGGESIDN